MFRILPKKKTPKNSFVRICTWHRIWGLGRGSKYQTSQISHFKKEETIPKGRINLLEAKIEASLEVFKSPMSVKKINKLENKFQKSSRSNNIYLFIFISKFPLLIKI